MNEYITLIQQQLHTAGSSQLTDSEWLTYLKKHPRLVGLLARADRSQAVTKAILSLDADVIAEKLGTGTPAEMALRLIEAAHQFAVWVTVSARTFGWPIQELTNQLETKPVAPKATPTPRPKKSKPIIGNVQAFCDAVGGEAVARKIISDMYVKKGSQGKAALALSRKYPRLLKRKNAQRTLSNWMKSLAIPVDNANQSPKRQSSKSTGTKTADYPYAAGQLQEANAIILKKRGIPMTNLLLTLKQTYSWPEVGKIIRELTGKNLHRSQLSRLYAWGKNHQPKKKG